MNKGQAKENKEGRNDSGVSLATKGSSSKALERRFSLLMTAIQLAQLSEERIYRFRIDGNEEYSLTGIADSAWEAATAIARSFRSVRPVGTPDARYVQIAEMVYRVLDAELHERSSYAEHAKAIRSLWQKDDRLTCPNIIMAFDFIANQRWLPNANEGEIEIFFKF